LALAPEDIDLQEVTFPDLAPVLDLESAFAVSYELPPALTGQSLTLYFDLFDNLNALASLAYVAEVQISTLPPTGPPPNLKVWSARQAGGPYQEEREFTVDPTNQVIRLVPEGVHGFFRLESSPRARVIDLSRDEEDWILTYAFDPETMIVESALSAEGPYTAEVSPEIDIVSQTIRLPLPDLPRFFRLRSEVAADLASVRVEPHRLVIAYAFLATSVKLLGADGCLGPYTIESATRHDSESREMRVRRGGSVRFLRLSADEPLRITNIWTEGSVVVVSYEVL
jgi:hypothetical protein